MLPLNERGITLGRSSECDFQIDDITVSRRHAVVAVGAEGIAQITDLGSSNGTFVNGESIAPHRVVVLEDGDRVQPGRQGRAQAGQARPARRAIPARHV